MKHLENVIVSVSQENKKDLMRVSSLKKSNTDIEIMELLFYKNDQAKSWNDVPLHQEMYATSSILVTLVSSILIKLSKLMNWREAFKKKR